MKKYFIHNGNNQESPFDIEELKLKGVSENTPIWYEGIDDWTTANNVDELKGVLKKATPPPFSITNPKKKKGYGLAFVIVLIIILVIIFNKPNSIQGIKDYIISITGKNIDKNSIDLNSITGVYEYHGPSIPEGNQSYQLMTGGRFIHDISSYTSPNSGYGEPDHFYSAPKQIVGDYTVKDNKITFDFKGHFDGSYSLGFHKDTFQDTLIVDEQGRYIFFNVERPEYKFVKE